MDNSVIIANNAQRTSIAAAEKVLPRTGSLKRKVYEYILKQGLRGATDYEIEKTFLLVFLLLIRVCLCIDMGLVFIIITIIIYLFILFF